MMMSYKHHKKQILISKLQREKKVQKEILELTVYFLCSVALHYINDGKMTYVDRCSNHTLHFLLYFKQKDIPLHLQKKCSEISKSVFGLIDSKSSFFIITSSTRGHLTTLGRVVNYYII